MSKKILIWVVLVFFVFSMNVALSDMEYPQELNQVCAPYPNATIIQTVNASGNVMVMMESEDNLDLIFVFYKKELVAKGWTISGEVKQQGNSFLMSEKGSNNVVVNVGSGQSGKSIISLSLTPK